MTLPVVLAIDQGTTSTTCLVIDQAGDIRGQASIEITQQFPAPGWVEHDAKELWQTTQRVALEALKQSNTTKVSLAAIGITNQRETICVWDPRTGEPLHNALVWQDHRTVDRCAELREAGYEPLVRARTGLILDPYFSATKIEWLLDHVDGLRRRIDQGHAVLGTVDSWIAWNLTGRHITDPSNASRTLCFDLDDGTWSIELCDLFSIPMNALPDIGPSIGDMGRIIDAALPGFGGVPVTAIVGDQQAALYGQAALSPGNAKATHGTGSFILVNVGQERPEPTSGLLTTVAWGIDGCLTYAVEASIFSTGATVQWLRDGLELITTTDDVERLVRTTQSNDGVYLVPAFTGLGSPYWDPNARGLLVGLTRGTGKAAIARAALESTAFQTVDAIDAIETAIGLKVTELRVDGGATMNQWLMQFQADALGVPIVVPAIPETTAFGVAMMAGVGAEVFPPMHVQNVWSAGQIYTPSLPMEARNAVYDEWQRAVKLARAWGA